jgi:uncharacterized protein YbjT (DUF2867 family)
MIIVTGATGGLGRAVVENLLRCVPTAKVAVSVRKPDDAQAFAARGVAVRRGDFDKPDSLVRSFDGADRLLIISASGIDHESRTVRHRNAIDAAVRAGVGHVYYTSLLPGQDSVAYVMKAHLDTEAYLLASGLPFTILKNGVYAEAWQLYLGDVIGDEVVIPADGPVSWVSRADLAEGTARLLYEGGHEGEMLNLTGPAALDIKAVAEILGRVRGRPLVVKIAPLEEYACRLISAGKSADFARQWGTTYLGMHRGEFGKVDPFLGSLLGRPLQTIAEVLARDLSAAV